MNGCTYIDSRTKEPIAWTKNYSSKIWKLWHEKGINCEIIEEPFYMHEKRQIEWLMKEGII